MGRCLVLLQLDKPRFIDTHERTAFSWMQTEEEGTGEWGRGEGEVVEKE